MAKSTVVRRRKIATRVVEKSSHDRQRRKFRHVVRKYHEKTEKAQESMYSTQVSYDDVFSELYESSETGARILEPTYKPGRLYWVHENSGFLPSCTAAMVHNVHGFGYKIEPVKGMLADIIGDEEATAEMDRIVEFMDSPNDSDSGKSLRKNLGLDFEVTGNMYIEVIRDNRKEPALLFWADARRVRACAVQKDPVPITVSVMRRGREMRISTYKHFRRYVMNAYQNSAESGSSQTTRSAIRYYKEYGDPRTMDAFTGEYLSAEEIRAIEADPNKQWLPATEIWHHKQGNGVYGVPRWIGNTLNILGLTKADFVNWDLFDSQGIPPLVITVSGGRLTDDSLEDLTDMIDSLKGTKQFNKTLLLETEAVDTGGINESTTQVRVDIKSMIEYRQNDAMFTEYGKEGRKSIRESFRLPSIFVGDSGGYNYSTAVVSRTTAEEQVFIPEREEFDDRFNRTILRDMGIKKVRIKSLGPSIAADELAMRVTPHLIRNGAFTLNELIIYTNKLLGLDLQLYEGEDQAWADAPLPMFLAIAEQLGLEGIMDFPIEDQLGLPSGEEESSYDSVDDSDADGSRGTTMPDRGNSNDEAQREKLMQMLKTMQKKLPPKQKNGEEKIQNQE